MFENIMSVERHSLLEQLVNTDLVRNFYLAGGTATALYLGHRWSEDLDFFTDCDFDPFRLVTELAKLEDFLLTGQEPGTVHCFINGVKLSFLHYPYPLLEKSQIYKGVRLASLKDIALMKMVALIQRGHFLLRQKELTFKMLSK